MSDAPSPIVNIDDAEEVACFGDGAFGQAYKVLTPTMEASGGSLGVNVTRVRPGQVACPFHHHAVEDEVFYVLSGRGVLRYGDEVYPLRPGDCVSCPAGTKTAHQIANTGDADLVYLAIGVNDPNEVCVYPDSGKVMIRSLHRVGHLREAPYMDAEPDPPRILALAASARSNEGG